MSPDEIRQVLELHRKWVASEDGGIRAYLSGANLSGANLHGADLSGANLSGANLSGANLTGIRLGWSSCDLIAEILWRAAGGSESRLMLAAYVGRRSDRCWEHWAKYEHPERDWALRELARWIRPDEMEAHVPAIVWAARAAAGALLL